MAWEPDKFTHEQRFAAAKAIVHAQVSVGRLNRSEFGAQHADLVHKVYLRIDDLLSMIHEDVYGIAGADYPPPSAS